MVAVRQKWQWVAVLLDWPLADSVSSVLLWQKSQNIVKKYAIFLASWLIAGQTELLDLRLVVTFPETITKNCIKNNLCCFITDFSKFQDHLHRTFTVPWHDHCRTFTESSLDIHRTFLTSGDLQISWFLGKVQTFRLFQFFASKIGSQFLRG